ncbi:MAG: D-alanyl-D-alanine carboxypeptidase family protein [Clostridia bacterium]
MKKRLKFFTTLVLITLLLIGAWPAAAFAASSGPDITGSAAYVYCATTEEVLWKKNASKQYNLASITKLMTCLLAAEKLDLAEEVTITQAATEVIKTESFVYAGEKIKAEDLVYAALLASANDAAKALAITVSGSEKKFVKLMNQKAKELGCKNTRFVTSSGVYNKNHYSSAEDIVKIARAAFANPDVLRIAKVAEYTVPATNKTDAVTLKTTNLFLKGGEADTGSGKIKIKKYKGMVAGKTGTTNVNRTTMVVLCKIDGFDIYAVILDSTLQQRYRDIKKLLDYAKATLSPYKAFESGQSFEGAKLKGGATNRVNALASADGLINLPEGASASLVTTQVSFDADLQAPIKKGQVIGKAAVYLADEKIREIDLTAAEDVKEGWFLSRFGITNLQTVILFFALAVILAFCILILVLRTINKRKRKAARQRRLMEAARRQMEREKDLKQRNWPY